MKMNGASVDARYIETVVIPRGDSQYVFKARPLTAEDDKFFEEACPRPKPPTFQVPGGKVESDLTNAQFVEGMAKWSDARSNFLFYKSLQATEDLEWDTVQEGDPATWANIETELKASGFLAPEIAQIFNAVVSANGLDASKIEEATKSFLAIQAAELS